MEKNCILWNICFDYLFIDVDLKFNINRNSLETWFESLARNVENQKGMIILFAVY